MLPFHGPQIDSSFPIPPFVRFLPLRLPRTWTVRPDESPAQAAPRRRLSLYGGTGILTSFPFDLFELRQALGSANPRLISIAEEPLLFSVVGILTRLTLLLWPGFSFLRGPHDLSAALPPTQNANLLDHPYGGCGQVSVVDLSPDHFGRLKPRPVSCYAFLRG